MNRITNQDLLIFSIVLGIALLYILSPILTPFLFGALLAFLMDPVVKRLEKFGLPHRLSVIMTFLILVFIILALILALIPLVQKQVDLLIATTPRIIAWVENTFLPWFSDASTLATIKTTLTSSLPKAGAVISAMLHSGYNIIEEAIIIILTPVVFFYLLRDWDIICDQATSLVPKSSRATALKLARQCSDVLSEFFRGQLLVMIALGIIYGIGLTLVGLQLGLMIGILGGILSIVPYLGSSFVLITSIVMALVQYGEWHAIIPVVVVFAIGQTLESYVLTPNLVGQRIGLHPVAVIFAILSGGTLFGFFGVLLALPVSAVVIVLLRFLRQKYIPA